MSRRILAGALCAAVAGAAAVAGPAAAAPAKKPRVTFIGDSVSASLLYVPSAVKLLSKGMDMRLDLKVCRRLATASCPYQGVTPSNALEVIQQKGQALGGTVVIDVGYNEDSTTYRSSMTKVKAALRQAKVSSVVWVTLNEERSDYQRINGVIRAAARKDASMCVADWAAAGRGRPYYGGDGLHLNTAGATALAKLIRPYALRAATTGSCRAA